MANIQRQALVSYSASQMYDLVNSISDYPDFVPYCKNAEIISSSENEVVAKLELDAGPIASFFTTRNTMIIDKQVVMTLEDGPFSLLQGQWTFTQLGEDGCKVELELNFEFTFKIASIAFGRIFNKMTEKLFDAFLLRAESVYK